MTTIPRQAAVWDEARNSSQLRMPSPTAGADCARALAALRRSQPALVQWVEDGYPTLTDEEHIQRFGEPYGRARSRRPARA